VAKTAQVLLKNRPRPSALSPYIFMTDPQRTPDAVAAARQIPEGATVIYRHFGAKGHRKTAKMLRHLTFERSQQFLIGHDPVLAIEVGADGVHFRRDAAVIEPALWRTRCPDWIITMAGLKGEQNYSGSLSVLDGLFLSSIFYSKSPSSGDPIGVERLSEVCAALGVPVIALGGINGRTATKLLGSGAAGVAGIDGLLIKNN